MFIIDLKILYQETEKKKIYADCELVLVLIEILAPRGGY